MQAVYRPYLHPRRQLPSVVPFIDPNLQVGAGTADVVVTAQASGVLVASSTCSVAMSAQGLQGDFISTATGACSVAVSVTAQGISIGTNATAHGEVRAALSAVATNIAAGGPATASAQVTISASAVGTRIQPGAGAVSGDLRSFVERKIDRSAEYRFSSGTRTRDFYQKRR